MTTLASPPPQAKSRLSIADDALLFVADFQAGIADLPLTLPDDLLRRHLRALLRLADIFELPRIVTAVPGGDGAVSALTPELAEWIGDTPVMVRTTPNSMNDAEIRSAIEESGRRTVLIAGVATEIAVGLPALTLAAEGYDVHVVTDASAGISKRSEDAMHSRLAAAGAHLTAIPTLVGELAGDFAQPRGGEAIGVMFELAAG